MDFNKNVIIGALILTSVICICGDCNKRKDCNELPYAFSTTIRAQPITDSINLSDTLWFVINDSVVLRDARSGEYVNFRNAKNLSLVFGIRKVISATNRPAAADSFQYYVRKGSLVSPSSNADLIREFRLIEEGNRYKLEVGFIALRQGVFDILVENSSNVYTDWTCRKASFSIMFSNTDQHFYLGYNISGGGVYYFKVK